MGSILEPLKLARLLNLQQCNTVCLRKRKFPLISLGTFEKSGCVFVTRTLIQDAKLSGESHLQFWAEKLAKESKRMNGKNLIDCCVSESKNENSEKSDFDRLLETCKRVDRSITEKNFTSIFMNSCLKLNNYGLGSDLMKWERKIPRKPSITTLSSFAKLCAVTDELSTDMKEKSILELFSEIKSRNQGLWGLEQAEKVIYAVSRTSRWQDCFEILESVKLGGHPSSYCYMDLTSAAFAHGQNDLGWKILNNELAYKPAFNSYLSWLRNCEKSEKNFEILLRYLNTNDVFPESTVIHEIKRYCEKYLGYEGTFAKILKNNICENCNHEFSSKFDTEQFERLQTLFLENVLKREDVFLNTVPKELRDFKSFVSKNCPYHYVVDGLNISYLNIKYSTPGKTLANVCHCLRQRSPNCKILILGRKHMLKRDKLEIKVVQQMADIYTIDDKSNDDPFLIWAALCSGPDCNLVSKDFMRNHTYRLDQDTSITFKRWRLSHQLQPSMTSNGTVYLKPVTPVLPIIHKSPNGDWHIPYEDIPLVSPHSFPTKWLCLKRSANYSR